MPEVARIYYTERLPAMSVPIAEVVSKSSTPADLTDINNIDQTAEATKAGSLLVQTYPVTHTSDAVIPGNAVRVPPNPASPNYKTFIVRNQFFEVTDQLASDGTPLFYRHLLPDGVRDITIVGTDGKPVAGPTKVVPGSLYHSLDGKVYVVRYYDKRNLRTELLKYTPAFVQASTASATTYQYSSGVISMLESKPYWFRFRQENGYSILPPYNTLPNEPWYLRIRSNIRPLAPEWGRQLFMPYRPFMLATWVPAQVLAPDIIEFERKPILFDGQRFPDVLVFDKDYKLKFALDGLPADKPARRGYLYPWNRAQIREIDSHRGRLRLSVQVEPDDRIFGFFYYAEHDIIYRDLDVNPFTNPALKNRVVEIVHNPEAEDPFRTLYHRVYEEGSATIYDMNLTNTSFTASGEVIGTFTVGASLSLNEFTLLDSRRPGGGLDEQFHHIPAAAAMWDLGRWDGRPFPIRAASIIYLPKTILQPEGRFTKEEARVLAASYLPLGCIPVVRFYDESGEEEL